MSQRTSILVILAAIVLGALVIDRGLDDDGPAEAVATVDRTEFPIATSPDSLASTWFCAGGTAVAENPLANHVVDVLNPTAAPVEVTVTVFGGDIAAPLETIDPESLDGDEGGDGNGEDAADESDDTDEAAADEDAAASSGPPEPVVQTFTLDAFSRRQIPLTEVLTAPVASALVEGPGGLVVEHEVVSERGRDAKPCATTASDTWHFAWGDTSVDATELLVFLNPYPDDAIVEGVFSTDDGPREPQRFDAFVVPARSVVGVDLGDDVTRRDEVAATFRTRTGRVVVDRIVSLNGEGGAQGLTVQTGVPEPQTTWLYADGLIGESTDEVLAVYNPTEDVAEVEVVFTLDDPETNGVAETLSLSLPPGRHDYVDLAEGERVPEGVPHGITVRSANGIPFVAERVLFATNETRRGISVTTGSPVEATEWFFAAGAANEESDEWLVLVNLDPQVIATVSVQAVAGGQLIPISELQDIELAAGERRAIRLGEHITRPDLPLVVTATEPIVVERGLYRVASGRGISNSVGVPGPEGLRLPFDDLAADLEAEVGELEVPTTGDGDDGVTPPTPPDDVELPEPDETIPIPDDEESDGGN